jgi:uncharacterized protein (TIGR02594 family)
MLHLLNLHRRRTGLLPLDAFKVKAKLNDPGRERARKDAWLEGFFSAIEEYQRTALAEAAPTGTIEPRSLAVAHLKGSLGTYTKRQKYTQPTWLAIASEELGVHELRGLEQNNPRILEFLGTVSGLAKYNFVEKGAQTTHKMSEVDETAWCACFVKWCLTQAGQKTDGFLAQARSWRNYGEETTPKLGAITVIYRTPFQDTSSGWHVGFYVGGPPDAPALLEGNQGNRVGFSQYFDLKDYYYRWPPR